MIDDFKYISSKNKIDSNLNKIIIYINDNQENCSSDAVESYRNMALNAAAKQYNMIQ